MKRFGHICTLLFAVLLFAQPLTAKPRKETGKVAFTATDMVLLYSGTTQSSYWDIEHVRDYVSYTDRTGKAHWLFDGFLLLEIRDFGPGSAGVAFDPGHKDTDGSYLQAAA